MTFKRGIWVDIVNNIKIVAKRYISDIAHFVDFISGQNFIKLS